MCISSSSSSLSSLAPLAIVSANESTTSNFKKIKTLDSRPSSNSLSLIKLPSVLIAEIFSYSSINVRASCSMRLCHGIQNLLLNIGSPHCILDVEDAKLRFNNEIAKRFINNRNFKIIRDIDFRGTKVKNPTDIFTHQMLNLKTLFIAESLQSNEEEEKKRKTLVSC